MTGHYKTNYAVEAYDIETRKLVYVYAYNIEYRSGLEVKLARVNASLKANLEAL